MKAQVFTQAIVFFLAAFLFILILFFGYKAITGFGERQEQIAIVDLKQGLQAKVSQMKTHSGDVDQFILRAPINELCMIDPTLNAGAVRPMLQPVFKTKTGNIILVKDGAILDKMYKDDIIVVENALVDPPQPTYCCWDLTKRSVKLRIEGFKGKAKLSSWDSQLNPCLK